MSRGRAAQHHLEHGGRLGWAARRWRIPRDQWLDLSTGVNRKSWPVPPIPERLWQQLPEDDDGLDQIIRQQTGAGEQAFCLPVAGSQAAIQALPLMRAPCRVGVPVPGFGEHARCWQEAGHEVSPITLDSIHQGDSWLAELDVLVWINPNNPTGLALPRERLIGWLQTLTARDGWLVVDEAFADGYGNLSLAPRAGAPGLVVLRSLGKFYGLAGVRAGTVLTSQAIGPGLARRLGPWAVSGPARHILSKALQDERWQARTSQRLQQESDRLNKLLDRVGLTGSSGTLLFRYLPHPNARRIADFLASQGVLVRYFDDPPALRLGLPGDAFEWERLERTVSHMAKIVDRGLNGC